MKRIWFLRLILAGFFTILLLLVGCSWTGGSYLRQELANTGPIPLSPQNPYLAANLVVVEEMERSRVFRGFISHRGAPDAIEIRQRALKPTQLYLFYLDDYEAFSFTETQSDWLIRGPEKLSPKVMSAFFNAPSALGRPALLESDVDANPVSRAEEEPIREPTVKNTLKKNTRKPAIVPNEKLPARENTVSSSEQPLVSPQPYAPDPELEKSSKPAQAVRGSPRTRKAKSATPTENELVNSHANASESTSGDLIHRVTFPGETLRIISAWYTGEAKTSNRIARINGIEAPDTLRMGQTVRIPRYLLKTTTPLPRTALTVEGSQ